jgi:enoyl-CoA hydratase
MNTESERSSVRVEDEGGVRVVTIDRPDRRNAVDSATAALLREAFTEFDEDDSRRSRS